MRSIFILLFTSLFSLQLISQTDSTALANVTAQATKMADLLVSGKYKDFTAYMYPPLVKLAGGQQSLIKSLKKVEKQLEKSGLQKMQVFINGPTEIVTDGGLQQAVVAEILELKMKTSKIKTKSSLIAISSDQGKHWTFIDTSGKTIQELKRMFPEISAQLIIPEHEAPEVRND